MMTTLSPEAQAVLDAANGFNSYSPDDVLNESRWIVAAALRAVADQVAPKCAIATTSDYSAGANNERLAVRSKLRAIASELAPEAHSAVPLPSAASNGRYPDLSPAAGDFDESGLLWWWSTRGGWRRDTREGIDCIPYPTHWAPGDTNADDLPTTP